MGDLATSLPSYFGFSGVRAVKERGCFLIDSGKIHKTNSGPREIYARFNLVKQIEAGGFFNTDGIIPASSGVPFVNLGRDIFVMTRNILGREPDMEKFDDIKEILKCLARFHCAARNINSANDIMVSPSLNEVFSKQISSLNSAVKQAGRRTQLSDFDVFVLKHAESYISLAKKAANILEQTNYASLHADAVKKNHICHNALKEETFSLTERGCFILRLEEMSVDLQLSDLASVLRRYTRKSPRDVPIAQLLEIYNEVLPLPDSAESILFAQLSFPWPFLKIVSQYYSKKRNFIPAAITSRMADVLDEQERYDEYINTLQF